jgi:broad specificity phosphatase PhoE
MIYVVRHGQTDWNLEGRFQGRIDIPLNEKGKNQAKKTKEKLEGIEFDKVFSSPLKRALETAQIITN